MGFLDSSLNCRTIDILNSFFIEMLYLGNVPETAFGDETLLSHVKMSIYLIFKVTCKTFVPALIGNPFVQHKALAYKGKLNIPVNSFKSISSNFIG